jgi:regulatory protein
VGEEASDDERLQKALGLALAHVNRRERTVAEVRAHLERKGIGETVADAVVEELRATRLLDDARYAALFVADKRELEGWGSERIRRGLREHGIDRELAEEALAGADAEAAASGIQPPSEDERALEILRRRFPEPPRERRDRDRALGVLVRKGYDLELALGVISAYARGD